jgi:hypothetical protein
MHRRAGLLRFFSTRVRPPAEGKEMKKYVLNIHEATLSYVGKAYAHLRKPIVQNLLPRHSLNQILTIQYDGERVL